MKTRSLRWLSCAALLLWLLSPATARGDKRYQADRFDVHVQLQPDGTTRVTETVVFRFEGGTFTRVSRDVPLRRTDGIDVLSARMDGAELPRGRNAGDARVEVSRGDNRLRIAWRFSPAAGTHVFALTYAVRGLVKMGEAEDVLAWNVFPRDHDYPIVASRITFAWPDAARLRSLAVDDRPADADAGSATIDLRDIRRDGFVTLKATFAPGTGAPQAPGWQQRAAFQRQVAPVWASLAAALLVLVSAFLWFVWVRSPRPAGTEGLGLDASPRAPADVPPAIAGALVAGGGAPAAAHALAAVLHLAQRGLLQIEELPKKRWGTRQFVLRREPLPGLHARLRPHEEVILDVVFSKKGQVEDEVEMSAVQRRLTGGSKAITEAVRQELREAGWLDPDRLRSRKRLMAAAAVVLGIGLASIPAAILFVRDHGGWPFLLPLALILSSVVGFVLAGAIPTQSDEGLRQGERWKRYGRQLRQAARERETAPVSADALPFAVAFGAAAAYAAALRRRGSPLPAWFHAASTAGDQQGAAFVALMSSSASGASSGAGAGGSGAAGGGSSSAS